MTKKITKKYKKNTKKYKKYKKNTKKYKKIQKNTKKSKVPLCIFKKVPFLGRKKAFPRNSRT